MAPTGLAADRSVMVSVIVPTYNRHEVLCQTIRDLLAQDYEQYELIIVDQSKSHPPDVAAFLESLPRHVNLISLERPNLPAARNVGVRRARGEIILFVDDDVRVKSGFIRSHLNNYSDPMIMAVAGSVLSPEGRMVDDLPWEVSDRYLSHFCACWQYDRRIEVKHAIGANHSFRRMIYERVGGYDESYVGPALREESDFFFRVWRAGMKIIYDPQCQLIHMAGAAAGGCWSAESAAGSRLRSYNHAYFVLKNMPRHQWIRMFLYSFRSNLLNRAMLRRGIGNFRLAIDIVFGWWRAARAVYR